MKKSVLALGIFSLLTFASCEKKDATKNGTTTEASSDKKDGTVITEEERAKLSPDDVLAELKKGNENFINGTTTSYDHASQIKEATKGQYPHAIVLSCIDSRVPVENIFNMSIGDLFVGRVAGNVEDKNMIGSFEFGAAVAGAKVLVIMGHSSCGAVKNAIDKTDAASLGMNDLASLLAEIDPAVTASMKSGEDRNSKNTSLVAASVEKNVLMTIDDIRTKSPTLKKMEDDGKLKIIGAVYDLETGKVNWL